MIIQFVLIICFVVFLILFLANPSSYQTRAWIKIFGLIFTILAIAAVLLPDSLNVLANKVGVTRGTDLLFYVFILIFIFTSLRSYIKDKQDNRRLVQVVRRIAILEAELQKKR